MKKLLTIICLVVSCQLSQAQWKTITSIPANRARPSTFTLAGSGYVVAGGGSGGYLSDTWQYTPGAGGGTWTRMADYPDASHDDADVGFTLGNTGYVGTGAGAGFSYSASFYQYSGGAWTTLASIFPGAARAGAVVFVIGDTAYVGGGGSATSSTNVTTYTDFYYYTQASGWSPVGTVASCPATMGIQNCAVAFTIGHKAYVGGGFSCTTGGVYTIHKDFWCYDPKTNTWTQVADFGGGVRESAKAFSICNKGYVMTGATDNTQSTFANDLWQYDPTVGVGGTWTQLASLPGTARNDGCSFVIGDTGYFGCGWDGTSHLADFYSYYPSPQVTVTPSNPLACAGTSIQLQASGGTSYQWIGTTNTTNTINAIQYSDTTYKLKVSIGTCAKDTAIAVNVTPAPPLGINAAPASICSGNSTTLTATGGTSYTWNNGATSSSISVSPTADSTFVFTGTALGCSAKDSVKVTVNPSPVATISGPQTICIGNSVDLQAGGGSTYTWAPSAGLSSTTITDPVASPVGTTVYTVTVANGSCTATDNVTVTVNPTPTLSVAGTATITIGQNTGLGVASGTGNTYTWSPAATLSCATCASPVAIPTASTWYTVTVTDNSNCSAEDSVLITVNQSCGAVYIPNAFSPNGDGTNDVLNVMGNCIKNLDLVIFDRWGNKVFETTNPESGWDGTWKGKPMNTGTYVFSVQITDLENNTINKKGNITLLR